MRVMRKKAMGMQKTGDTISITIPESMFLNENGLNVSLDYEDLLDWCFQSWRIANEYIHERTQTIQLDPSEGHQENKKRNAYIRWEQPQCPRQPAYTKYCGYFVCRYMLDIVQKRVLWVSNQVFPLDLCTYSSEDIDEMRDLWIKYVLDHEPDEEDS